MLIRYPAVILSAVLITAFAVSCGGDEEGNTIPPEIYDAQVDAPVVGGGSEPRYEEPIPVTTGDYWPPGVDYNEARDEAAAASSETGPLFSGEIAGLRLVREGSLAADDRPDKCKIAEFPLAVHFRFGYLPPGTSLASPQYEAKCADGTVSGASQSFVTMRGEFYVTYWRSEPNLEHDALASRVHESRLLDRPALVIESFVEEGLGPGLAAMTTDNGFVVVSGRNVPTDELLGVLGGIECGDC